VDLMGVFGPGPEEGVKAHKKSFTRVLAPHTVKFTRMYYPPPPEGTDLFICDYGEMLPGCTDLLESNAREICRWAQDHPSSLVVIASSFTYEQQIAYELAQRGLALDNIICDDGSQEAEDRIRAFFELSPLVAKPRTASCLITPKKIGGG